MGYRGDVLDRADRKARRLQGLDRRFASGPGSLDTDVNTLDAEIQRLLGAVLGGDLSRKRSRLLRALEAALSCRAPCDRVAQHVADRDERVVERGRDMRHAFGLDHAGLLL